MIKKIKFIVILLISLLLIGCEGKKEPEHEHEYEKITEITEYINNEDVIIEYKCKICSEIKTENKGSIFTFSEKSDGVYITRASYKFPQLKTVRLADTYNGKPVIGINNAVFRDLPELHTVIIPKSITKITDHMFNGCPKVENIYYEGTLNDWFKMKIEKEFFFNSQSYEHFYVKDENGEYIEVENLVIPEEVTHIGDYLFNSCKNIKSIEFHDKVESIGKGTFMKCTKITSLVIPDSVTEIKGKAFDDCSVKTLVIPYIDNFRYSAIGCLNCVEEVTLTKGKFINDKNDDESEHVLIGFDYSFGLEKITIPSMINVIGEEAFCGCPKLKTIIFENANNIKRIEDRAFISCEALTSFVIPESVVEIGESVFSNCTNLRTLTIPKSIKEFKASILKSDMKLKDIYYDGTIEDWCNIDFQDGSSCNPGGNAENLYFKNENNEYYLVEEIVLPDTITRIGQYQFARFNISGTIIVPPSVKSIERAAFFSCENLEKIFIDKTVEFIDDSAFDYCNNLTIYCEYKSRPNTWHKNWCGRSKVVWNYKTVLDKE